MENKMTTDFIIEFSTQATRIIVPIIIFLGITSNILNIIILTRPSLNRHACSLYFCCMAIINLFYCTFLLTNNLLADGYQLNYSLYSTSFCKLTSYLLNFCPNLSVYLIVLASIDRFSASTIHAKIRRFSDIRVARWAVFILIIMFTILFSGAFIAFDLIIDGIRICTIPSDFLFGQVFLTIDMILYVILAPVCMLSFGLLTIHNTNQVALNSNRLTHYHRTERQLSRMLLLQVSIHVILTLPFCAVFFMINLPISFRYSLDFYYTSIVCKLPFYLSFTTGFFSYILSARVYRQELVRLFKKLYSNPRVSPVQINNIVNLDTSLRIRTIHINH